MGKDFNDMSFSKVHYRYMRSLEYTIHYKQQHQWLAKYYIASTVYTVVGKGLIRLSVRLIMGGLEYTYVDNKPSP